MSSSSHSPSTSPSISPHPSSSTSSSSSSSSSYTELVSTPIKGKSKKAKIHTPPTSPLPPVPPAKFNLTSSTLSNEEVNSDSQNNNNNNNCNCEKDCNINDNDNNNDDVDIKCDGDKLVNEDSTENSSTTSSNRKPRLQRHHYRTINTIRHTPPTAPLPPLPPATYQPQQSPQNHQQLHMQPQNHQQLRSLNPHPQFLLSSYRKPSPTPSTASPQTIPVAEPADYPLQNNSTDTTTTTRSLTRTTSGRFSSSSSSISSNSSNNSPWTQRPSSSYAIPRLRLSTTSITTAAALSSSTATTEHEHERMQAMNRSSSALDIAAMESARRYPGSARLPAVDAPDFPAGTTPRRGRGSSSNNDGDDDGDDGPALAHSVSLTQIVPQPAKGGSDLGTPRRFGSIKKFFTMRSPDKSVSAGTSPRKGPLRAMLRNRSSTGQQQQQQQQQSPTSTTLTISSSSISSIPSSSSQHDYKQQLSQSMVVLAESQSMPASLTDSQGPGQYQYSQQQQQQQQQSPPSMLTTMFNPALKESFHGFLRGKFADENMLFVDDCAQFAESAFATPQALDAAALRIYDTYVRPGAPLELNLGFEQRRPLEEALTSGARISQAVFEDLSLDIRNFMEVAFLPAWLATGAWRAIPHRHYAPNLPSLQQVLGSRRLLNQLLLYVASHGGAQVAEALVACEEFEAKPSLETFVKVVGWGQEFGGGGREMGEVQVPSEMGEISPEACGEVVACVRKRVCKVLETEFYLDWVVRKTWTSVYIPPHHHHHHHHRRDRHKDIKENEKKEEIDVKKDNNNNNNKEKNNDNNDKDNNNVNDDKEKIDNDKENEQSQIQEDVKKKN